mmetsp:Transcript_65979/g.157589  ORF Transcript_65979/g.157589 Transcript_65979/m.157589 type:complete len:227 (-) Transcript_65979:244-924(-)
MSPPSVPSHVQAASKNSLWPSGVTSNSTCSSAFASRDVSSGDVTCRTNPDMMTGDITASGVSTIKKAVPFPKRSPFRIFGYETGCRETPVGSEASQIGGMCTCVVWYPSRSGRPSTNKNPAPSENAKVDSAVKLTRPLTARVTVLLSQKVASQTIGESSPDEAQSWSSKPPSPSNRTVTPPRPPSVTVLYAATDATLSAAPMKSVGTGGVNAEKPARSEDPAPKDM